MARRAKKGGSLGGGGNVQPPADTAVYRHKGEKRKNNPPAKIAAEGSVPPVPKAVYYYSPHLPPVLRFDPSGKADQLPELVAKAGRQPLTPEEQRMLAEALRMHEPWLEWATKREQHERGKLEVDPVALHIHERVSAEAIVRAAMREDVQRDLFADPQQSYQQAVQFYRHDVEWANRLILGDSLQVMSSLARREGLAGKVQMIYMDPPYGIKFASNFQPEVGKRDVKDKETDLTREAEMVRAYRDTWSLGTHSYLAYLRERVIAAHQLLCESGSIFVQISDQNIHRVRALLDEVFGVENFVSQIAFKKTGGMAEQLIDNVADYLLWYAKCRGNVKFRRLFDAKVLDEGVGERYSRVELATGEVRPITAHELDTLQLEPGARAFLGGPMTSQTPSVSTTFEFDFEDKRMRVTRGGWKTNAIGMQRLANAGRLLSTRDFVNYRMYIDDFPAVGIGSLWFDTMGTAEQNKMYIVQTTTKVVQRCVLMTTDPGDLLLDPTCGSGTTAYVAEQWGRRWVTVDTSRVALAIARQRLVTARFDHYKTKGSGNGSWEDPGTGFLYKKVTHVTLKSITQNANLDPIFAKHQPLLASALTGCTKALKQVHADTRRRLAEKLVTKERAEGKRAVTDADRRRWELPEDGFEHWTVPFDTDPDWPKALQETVTLYRRAWRAKMDEVNAGIAANADQEELVDQPEVVKGVVRVSGPFTVEGVRPEELSMGEEGLFDGTPNEFEASARFAEPSAPYRREPRNQTAYLSRMVQLLRQDGVTFIGNKQKRFARLEPLFESGHGSEIDAEGAGRATSRPGRRRSPSASGRSTVRSPPIRRRSSSGRPSATTSS